MSQDTSQVESSQKITKLDHTWNGLCQEFINYRTKTLGKVLTIIDAVIVDEVQNKSVKRLITNTVWENEYSEVNLAKWLIWLDNTSNISDKEDSGESMPMKYVTVPAASLDGYRDR